ncbi:hypothetical protein [Brevundimonas sp.]|uniref:hypothetical protein n=1 Tax=Brevundimonas sp. TaxID=1871086 RepID=UPI002E132345
MIFRITTPAVFLPAMGLSAAWLGFCSWRAMRLFRVVGIKSARDYDRVGKYRLPPEYARSDSYLAHQKRGRAGRAT